MEQLAFSGELTIGRAEELVTALQQALHSTNRLVIDLTAVERIDTAAAHVLLAARLQAKQSAISLSFSCSDTVIRRLASIGIQL